MLVQNILILPNLYDILHTFSGESSEKPEEKMKANQTVADYISELNQGTVTGSHTLK